VKKYEECAEKGRHATRHALEGLVKSTRAVGILLGEISGVAGAIVGGVAGGFAGGLAGAIGGAGVGGVIPFITFVAFGDFLAFGVEVVISASGSRIVETKVEELCGPKP
jgi:predicted lipid-binding transport protein (Tim44 family)